MARVNRWGFLAIAMAFHVVYIFSIFDIYFVSPIVSGMREFEAVRPQGAEAPAKRLILFVGTSACPGFELFANKNRRWIKSR